MHCGRTSILIGSFHLSHNALPQHLSICSKLPTCTVGTKNKFQDVAHISDTLWDICKNVFYLLVISSTNTICCLEDRFVYHATKLCMLKSLHFCERVFSPHKITPIYLLSIQSIHKLKIYLVISIKNYYKNLQPK